MIMLLRLWVLVLFFLLLLIISLLCVIICLYSLDWSVENLYLMIFLVLLGRFFLIFFFRWWSRKGFKILCRWWMMRICFFFVSFILFWLLVLVKGVLNYLLNVVVDLKMLGSMKLSMVYSLVRLFCSGVLVRMSWKWVW